MEDCDEDPVAGGPLIARKSRRGILGTVHHSSRLYRDVRVFGALSICRRDGPYLLSIPKRLRVPIFRALLTFLSGL